MAAEKIMGWKEKKSKTITKEIIKLKEKKSKMIMKDIMKLKEKKSKVITKEIMGWKGKKAIDGCGTADFFETAARQRRSRQQKDDKPFYKTIIT